MSWGGMGGGMGREMGRRSRIRFMRFLWEDLGLVMVAP